MQDRFYQFWEQYIGDGKESVHSLLLLKYNGGTRGYHNFNHIEHCIYELDSFVSEGLLHSEIFYLFELEFALLFHDIIYDPRLRDNEEKSADLAVEVAAKYNVSEVSQMKIREYILATKHNREPKDYEEELIIDIDLSILGASEEAFDQYDERIREEYYFVERDVYQEGRTKILKGFLNRKNIFCTSSFSEKYEFRARENLNRAIYRLELGDFK